MRTSKLCTLVLVLALGMLACGAEPTATPFKSTNTPQPTVSKTPRATKTPLPKATKTAKVTATPEVFLEVDPDFYVYEANSDYAGVFSLRPPAGWEMTEYDNSVYWDWPSSEEVVASIGMIFTNAGVELSAEELDDYIDAVETGWFQTFDNYELVSRSSEDGRVAVLKTLNWNDVEQTVLSYYWTDETLVLRLDLWAETPRYESCLPGFQKLTASVTTEARVAKKMPLYALRYTYADPAELFEFKVPYGWVQSETTDDTTSVVTFTSPDSRTAIQNITFDDGTQISKSVAGQVALALLKQAYGLTDIRVTADQVQPDGSERLDWRSQSKRVKGVSFFETRGTTFLMLSWLVDTDYYDLYLPVWTALLDTYAVPEGE